MHSVARISIHNDLTSGRTATAVTTHLTEIVDSTNKCFEMRLYRVTRKAIRVMAVATAAVTTDDGEITTDDGEVAAGPGK